MKQRSFLFHIDSRYYNPVYKVTKAFYAGVRYEIDLTGKVTITEIAVNPLVWVALTGHQRLVTEMQEAAEHNAKYVPGACPEAVIESTPVYQ